MLTEALKSEIIPKGMRDFAKNVRGTFIVARSMQAEAKVKICCNAEWKITGGLCNGLRTLAARPRLR